MTALTLTKLAEALSPFGVEVTPLLAEQISEYMRLLLLWNQKVSLTSVTRPEEILSRHFGESFFGAIAAGIEAGRLADVGSGAGFPGLALKLLRPKLRVTLIEPNLKKSAFLTEVVRGLGVRGVEIVPARFGQVSPDEIAADWITSRALGDYRELLRWSQRALRAGRVILWVGRGTAAELELLPGWSFESPLAIPNSRERVLLIASPGSGNS